jgi:hypothetical protein
MRDRQERTEKEKEREVREKQTEGGRRNLNKR